MKKLIATFAVFALMLSATSMQAANDPIPGIDVIVKKNPGGNAVYVSQNRNGAPTFFTEAGEYTISIVCRKPPCVKFTAVVNANGKALKANADGTYDFAVEGRKPVSITAQLTAVATSTKLPNSK
jgi:hypothetical protein